jgi:hypothetical protein
MKRLRLCLNLLLPPSQALPNFPARLAPERDSRTECEPLENVIRHVENIAHQCLEFTTGHI